MMLHTLLFAAVMMNGLFSSPMLIKSNTYFNLLLYLKTWIM